GREWDWARDSLLSSSAAPLARALPAVPPSYSTSVAFSRTKTQQVICVAMKNFFLVSLADRRVTDECYTLGAGIIGIIYREHDPIDAKLGDATGQRRRLKVSAGRQIKMFAEGVGECARAADVFENPVTAPQCEWNGFAEMAEDDFQPREGVKHPA